MTCGHLIASVHYPSRHVRLAARGRFETNVAAAGRVSFLEVSLGFGGQGCERPVEPRPSGPNYSRGCRSNIAFKAARSFRFALRTALARIGATRPEEPL